MNLSQDDLKVYLNRLFDSLDKKIDSLHKKIDALSEGIKSFKSPLDQNLLKQNLSVNESLGELISPTSSITFKKGVGEINSPKTSLNDSVFKSILLMGLILKIYLQNSKLILLMGLNLWIPLNLNLFRKKIKGILIALMLIVLNPL